MSLKRFIYFISGSTAFSWLAWLIVLFYVDPEICGTIGIVVFYAALFFSLLGLFILINLGLKMAWLKLRKKDAIAFKCITQSIRQAIWFSLVVIGALWLSAYRLFTWWSCGILLLGFIILEGFFLSRNFETKRNTLERNDSNQSYE